jgi:hypothetical protein
LRTIALRNWEWAVFSTSNQPDGAERRDRVTMHPLQSHALAGQSPSRKARCSTPAAPRGGSSPSSHSAGLNCPAQAILAITLRITCALGWAVLAHAGKSKLGEHYQALWSCPGRPRECPHRGSSKRSRSALRVGLQRADQQNRHRLASVGCRLASLSGPVCSSASRALATALFRRIWDNSQLYRSI